MYSVLEFRVEEKDVKKYRETLRIDLVYILQSLPGPG